MVLFRIMDRQQREYEHGGVVFKMFYYVLALLYQAWFCTILSVQIKMIHFYLTFCALILFPITVKVHYSFTIYCLYLEGWYYYWTILGPYTLFIVISFLPSHNLAKETHLKSRGGHSQLCHTPYFCRIFREIKGWPLYLGFTELHHTPPTHACLTALPCA